MMDANMPPRPPRRGAAMKKKLKVSNKIEAVSWCCCDTSIVLDTA